MGAKREHLWIGLLVGAGALTWFLLLLAEACEDGRIRVGFERAALGRLRAVAAAQREYHRRRGRYGWATDLQAAGLLPSPWMGRDGDVQGTRYRIDVLLPHAVRVGDLVEIAPRSAGHANPKLETRHFAVVARPRGPGRSGHRTYYEDESGVVWYHEGVVVVGGLASTPLPPVLLTRGKPAELSTFRWNPLNDPPAAESLEGD